jgi:4-amino-4-deoxy-L-arabinose transferase-like glycosyltransferase
MVALSSVAERAASSRKVFVPVFLVLAVIALKLPVLHTPYYWDEAFAYFNPSLWLSSHEFVDAFPGRHPAEMFFGHPPLLYLIMACLFKVFGHAPVVAHVPIIMFAAMGVLYTYKLGDLLFGRDIGIGAAVVLFSSPLYFTQSGMFLGDIPVAACSVATVYYYLRNNSFRYLLLGTSAVLIKEHAALLILILVLYDHFNLSGQVVTLRRKFIHAFPLCILGIFFLLQKLLTGRFLPNPYFYSNSFISMSIAKLAFKIAFANYWAFFAQGRFLLTMVSLLAAWRFRTSLPGYFLLFTMIIGSYVAAYSFIYFIPRYIIVVMPFICLIGSSSLALLFKERFRYAAALTVLVSVSILFPDIRNRGNLETTMQYLDVVSIHRQAATFLERTASGELIYAPWPISSVWAEAAFGYVKTPLNMTMDPNSPWKYVVLTDQADKAQAKTMDIMIRRDGLDNVAHFECSGKVLDVFSRRSPVLKGKEY